MCTTFLLLICLFSSVPSVILGDISRGYTLVNIQTNNRRQFEFLHDWRQKLGTSLDYWSERLNGPIFYSADVLVSPNAIQEVFIARLRENGIKVEIIIDDMLEFFENEAVMTLFESPPSQKAMVHNSFLKFEQIESHLRHVQVEHPDLVQLERIGHTHENRNLTLVKVGTCGDCPSIFIEAGIHAREWLSPAVALNLIDKLIDSSKSDHHVNKVNWYILPVTNPDGYSYSHKGPQTRLWRKNRSPARSSDVKQTGVDLNRNFDYYWGTMGTMHEPAADTYPGPVPASEPETQAIQNFAMKHRTNIQAYIALHTYGQKVVYNCPLLNRERSDCSRVDEETIVLGEKMVAAIGASGGEVYEAGATAEIIYEVSGTSDQWAQFVANISLAYTIEMRPRSDWIGFDISSANIMPTTNEIWAALKVLADAVIGKTKKSGD